MSARPRAATFAALLCLTLLGLLTLVPTAVPTSEAAPPTSRSALPLTTPLQPSIPLPENCGGTLPLDSCCVRGFVYFQGQPVWGAHVTIMDSRGVTESFTTTYGLLHGLPHYGVAFSDTPLSVERGTTITLTATYAGLTVTRTQQMSQRSHQVDLAFTTTTRASLPSISESNQPSRSGHFSADGNLVVFTSDADNLVTGDTNGVSDVFVHNRRTGVTQRVSVHSDGRQGNDRSYSGSISGDGKTVAFISHASNLIDEDANERRDVFIHLLDEHKTLRISLSDAGSETSGEPAHTALSEEGQFILFHSNAPDLVPGDGNGNTDVFRYDRRNSTMELVSVTPSQVSANNHSYASSMSANGRYVAFYSLATNLVTPTLNRTERHIYVRDMMLGITRLVSVSPQGEPGVGASHNPSISDDGNWVAFQSEAQNLAPHPEASSPRSDIFLRDMANNQTFRVTVNSEDEPADGNSYDARISDDGQLVAFQSNATNLEAGTTDPYPDRDFFLYDHATRDVRRLSVPYHGIESDAHSDVGALSGDGQWALFASVASDIIPSDTNGVQDLFVRHIESGATTRVALPDPTIQSSRDSAHPDLSANGRWVVFTSAAPNLAPGNPRGKINVFRRDRTTGQTVLVSRAPDGSPGNGHSLEAVISDDGRWVAFLSHASNLVVGDSNGRVDVFLRDMEAEETQRLSLDWQGNQTVATFADIALSGDGRWLAYSSDAETLVQGDQNGKWDVFLHEVATGTTRRLSVSALGARENGSSHSPAFSPREGRYVVFRSAASNLVAEDQNQVADIFLWDGETQVLERVSLALPGLESNDHADHPVVSRDGRYVAFASGATTLVERDTNSRRDIFIRDRERQTTYLASVSSAGVQANHDSDRPSLSEDGQIVAFHSRASTLVRPDSTNQDIFVHDVRTRQTTLVSRPSLRAEGDGQAQEPSLSADGRHVAFASTSATLVPSDTNGVQDIFVVDRGNGTIPIPPTLPHTEWVLMFYLAGDNDLSDQMEDALARLDTAASNHPRLTIVALIDGPGVNDTYHHTFQQGEQVARVHMPERDMGDGQTLQTFVHATFNRHPASHYYLNIADHGRGTTGIAWDEQGIGGNSYLQPAELRDALLAATSEGQRLDILHLDACLMNLLEVAYDAKDVTDYLIASQYLAWAPFRFDSYARAAEMATTPVDLARSIVGRYHHALETAPGGPLVHTIAALDLAHMPHVQSALDEVLAALEGNPDWVATVQQARSLSQKFPSRAPYEQIPDSAEYIDLADFAHHLQASSDPVVRARALTLMNIVRDAVVTTEHRSPNPHAVPAPTWSLDGSNGLSFYFPAAPGGAEYESYRQHTLFGFTAHSYWDEFLANYYSQAGIPPHEPGTATLPPVQVYQEGYQLFLPHVTP